MKVIGQVSVGYTDDPLWGFCSVFKIEWDDRPPTWSIIGSYLVGEYIGRRRKELPYCPLLNASRESVPCSP